MLLSVALLSGWLLAAPSPAPQAAAEQVPVAAAKLIAQGDALAAKQDLQHALEAYKKADNIAGHQSVTCLLRVAMAERGLGDLNKAADAAQQAVAVAQGRPTLIVIAESKAGQLLANQAGFGRPKLKPLLAAEAAYRAALAAATSDAERDQFRFALGVILLREKRNPEGLAILQALAAADGSLTDNRAELAKQAREIAANPALALEPLAPDFTLTASDGHMYSKDGFAGKVALIDFWGSWCPPCRESVPMLVALRKSFAKDADFVMLGVGNDDSAAIMEGFAAAHHMKWPEYFDADNRISKKFNVDGLPTFILLNRDGSVAYRLSGLEETAPGDPSATARQLANAIRQALRK